MSFAVTPAQPKARPNTVTYAVYLLYLVAAIEVVSALLTLSSLGTVRDIYEEEYAGTSQADTIGTAITAGTAAAAGLSILLAVAFIVLALLVGRGKNPARIVTWVVSGLAVLCFGCGAIGAAGGGLNAGTFGGSDDPDLPDPGDVAERANAALPSWQEPLGLVLALVSIAALLAVIILLALPASGPFFAKEQEVWVPPTQYPTTGAGDEMPPTAPPTGGAPPPIS